jgi:hypothetical protein
MGPLAPVPRPDPAVQQLAERMDQMAQMFERLMREIAQPKRRHVIRDPKSGDIIATEEEPVGRRRGG